MAPKSKAIRYALTTFERLRAHHADADCELVPRDPFQLLVAVVLSAQTTDAAVNRVLPDLFATMPDAASFATAQAKHLVGLAKQIMEHHQGQVPRQFDALVQLPGVGRKTANVVMGVAFGIPSGVVVDTHVQRLSQRLGWTKQQQPESIEKELSAVFPKEVWIILSHVLIFHGRRVCTARAPACERCVVSDVCPSAGKAENVGRKPSRMRSLRE